MKALTALAVLVGFATVIPIARGGTDVDCSDFSPWSKGHGHYSKGDRVTLKVPKYRHEHCSEAPDRTSDWTLLGECEYGTAK
jgi:hypothetical protein